MIGGRDRLKEKAGQSKDDELRRRVESIQIFVSVYRSYEN